VEYAGVLDWRVQGVENSAPLDVRVDELYRRPGQVGYRLNMTLKPDAPPGSHRWEPGRQPAAGDTAATATMSPGSAMFYLGSLWHGGGANSTAEPRLGVILEYAASWLRPQENQCLAVPRGVARQLPERLQELLGYNIYPPFVGYVDGRHPRRVLSADP
jgi:ectoine hydroxylase-related dioxygenase (phytanoyl-CoA dioxygenase family)